MALRAGWPPTAAPLPEPARIACPAGPSQVSGSTSALLRPAIPSASHEPACAISAPKGGALIALNGGEIRCGSAYGFPSEERGGRPGNASSPHQFSPLWKPPFPDPPSKLEQTKGGKPQGDTARRLSWRGWGNCGDPSLPAEPRPAALRVSGPQRRSIPLALKAPAGQAHWSGRGGLVPHTSSVLQSVRQLTRQQISPLAPLAPGGDGRVGFDRRAGPARKSACKTQEAGAGYHPRHTLKDAREDTAAGKSSR
jgi:hypothetical protein